MKREAVVGGTWILIDQVGGQTLSFISFIILARLLLPEYYGLMTLVGTIIAVPSILISDGFGAALVQRENISDHHINVAFWANLFLSVFFVAILIIGADLAAEITHTPMVAPLLRLLSLTMIPFAISSVTSALFLRKIQFRTFAQSGSAITGIIMALLSVDRNDTVSRGSNFSPRDLARFNRGA